jgi:signal transduction histidine kinase
MSERLTARLHAWSAAGWCDPALATVFATASVAVQLASDGTGRSAGAIATIVLGCAPLAVMRRNAVAAACAAAVITVVTEAIGYNLTAFAFPISDGLAMSALSYGCGAFARSVPGAVGMTILLAALEVTSGIPHDAWVPVLFSTVGPWLAGRAVRSRREVVTALAHRTRELQAEQDAFSRLAVRHERARIARELHDIVAHNLAIMVVQAGAGRMATRDHTERTAERFSSIGDAGAQALSEMARLVDVLHAADGESNDHQGRLRLVLHQARAAGLTIHAMTLPRGVQLPPELEDIAHCIVQEGVTNTLKHAPRANVHVRLVVYERVLEVEVRDDGARTTPTLADTGAGLGLTGLHERVTAIGGQLDAGPEPGAGWRLHARLPMSFPSSH